ncbi:MAG: hydrogenase nickel incorporation protein HypB [Candidatus Eisenbacteria bacterium]|nr:hydrogenase nickel incorporation protein HypB [Candidatus Eisenbacteria bacterium]
MKIQVVKSVLKANDAVAMANRERLSRAGVLAVNITSAPGSGKTALLERTIPALLPDHRSAVIVGDLQTTRDAERLGAVAERTVQINTEGGCHLQATQIAQALEGLDLSGLGFLFIENVGNMVCPAGFDLGEHVRVAMLSTPEGPDKVAKYPTLFQPADAIVLNKTDLAPMLGFDDGTIRDDLSRINTRAPLFPLSAATGEGFEAWLGWLREKRAGKIA